VWVGRFTGKISNHLPSRVNERAKGVVTSTVTWKNALIATGQSGVSCEAKSFSAY